MDSHMELLNLDWIKTSLSHSKKCVVGVSGGVDSMVLLHWLSKIRIHLPDDLTVMHINHGLHGNSSQWADLVEMTCLNIGFKCEIKNVTFSEYGNNVEYAARQARYVEFCKTGADTLILAHHMNDQIETFFLKLFRGSGIRGLKSMPMNTSCWYDESVTVVRPLLNVSRSTIEAYAALNDIKYCDDPSNDDVRYDRNYIRHKIWPVIKERFDIGDINIAKSIAFLGEAWELTNTLAENDLCDTKLEDDVLDWEKVKNLGTIRIKNLILYILRKYQIYGYSIGHIEQFSSGLERATYDSRNELYVKGFRMQKHGKKIFIKQVS